MNLKGRVPGKGGGEAGEGWGVREVWESRRERPRLESGPAARLATAARRLVDGAEDSHAGVACRSLAGAVR